MRNCIVGHLALECRLLHYWFPWYCMLPLWSLPFLFCLSVERKEILVITSLDFLQRLFCWFDFRKLIDLSWSLIWSWPDSSFLLRCDSVCCMLNFCFQSLYASTNDSNPNFTRSESSPSPESCFFRVHVFRVQNLLLFSYFSESTFDYFLHT
jgi:hypothetical protein